MGQTFRSCVEYICKGHIIIKNEKTFRDRGSGLNMNKPLLYFSYLIIVANIIILSAGYVAKIAFIGSFLGGLMAIGTDPIILILGALLGAGLVAKPYKFSVIYLWLGAMFLTMLVHVILGTTKVMVDVVKFDALLIISALIIIITSFFRPLIIEITEDFDKTVK